MRLEILLFLAFLQIFGQKNFEKFFEGVQAWWGVRICYIWYFKDFLQLVPDQKYFKIFIQVGRDNSFSQENPPFFKFKKIHILGV